MKEIINIAIGFVIGYVLMTLILHPPTLEKKESDCNYKCECPSTKTQPNRTKRKNNKIPAKIETVFMDSKKELDSVFDLRYD